MWFKKKVFEVSCDPETKKELSRTAVTEVCLEGKEIAA